MSIMPKQAQPTWPSRWSRCGQIQMFVPMRHLARKEHGLQLITQSLLISADKHNTANQPRTHFPGTLAWLSQSSLTRTFRPFAEGECQKLHRWSCEVSGQVARLRSTQQSRWTRSQGQIQLMRKACACRKQDSTGPSLRAKA